MRRCRLCRCSEREPCNPPCGWDCEDRTLCTNCGLVLNVIANWLISAHRPSVSAMLRDAKIEASK
jgi:hypothetical protein